MTLDPQAALPTRPIPGSLTSKERFELAGAWCQRHLPLADQRLAVSTCLSLRLSNGRWPTPEEVRAKLQRKGVW